MIMLSRLFGKVRVDEMLLDWYGNLGDVMVEFFRCVIYGFWVFIRFVLNFNLRRLFY